GCSRCSRAVPQRCAVRSSGAPEVGGAVRWGEGRGREGRGHRERSAPGEAPGVLAVLTGVVVVVVDGRCGVVLGEGVVAVAVVPRLARLGGSGRALLEVDGLVRAVGLVAAVLGRGVLAADAGDGGAELI